MKTKGDENMIDERITRNFALLYYQTQLTIEQFSTSLGYPKELTIAIIDGEVEVDLNLIKNIRVVYGVDIASELPYISRKLKSSTRATEKDKVIRRNYKKFINTLNIEQKSFAKFFSVSNQFISNIVNDKAKVPVMLYTYIRDKWGIDLSNPTLDFNAITMPPDLSQFLEENKTVNVYRNLRVGEGARQNFINLYKSTNKTTREFAKELGYTSTTTVSAVLRGKEPTYPLVAAVQRRYGVDINSSDFSLSIHENTQGEAVENLRYVIHNSGLSVTAFAKETGVELTYLSHILKGDRTITPKVTAKIQLKYHVDLLHDKKEDLVDKLRETVGCISPSNSYIVMDGPVFEQVETKSISHYISTHYSDRRDEVKVYKLLNKY